MIFMQFIEIFIWTMNVLFSQKAKEEDKQDTFPIPSGLKVYYGILVFFSWTLWYSFMHSFYVEGMERTSYLKHWWDSDSEK